MRVRRCAECFGKVDVTFGQEYVVESVLMHYAKFTCRWCGNKITISDMDTDKDYVYVFNTHRFGRFNLKLFINRILRRRHP